MTPETWVEGIIAVTSERDGLAVASAIVAIVASLFAIGAAIIGYLTYSRAIASNRVTHMHSVFRDYLSKRVDVCLGPPICRAEAEIALRTLKLYTLDEMALWLKRECGRHGLKIECLSCPDRPGIAGRIPWLQSAWNAKRLELLGWLRTIESHLVRDPAETASHLVRSRSCYGATLWSIANGATVLQSEIIGVLAN